MVSATRYSTRRFSIQALTSSLVSYFPFFVASSGSLLSWLFVIRTQTLKLTSLLLILAAASSRLLEEDRPAGILLLGRNGRRRFKEHAHLAFSNNRYADDDHLR